MKLCHKYGVALCALSLLFIAAANVRAMEYGSGSDKEEGVFYQVPTNMAELNTLYQDIMAQFNVLFNAIRIQKRNEESKPIREAKEGVAEDVGNFLEGAGDIEQSLNAQDKQRLNEMRRQIMIMADALNVHMQG